MNEVRALIEQLVAAGVDPVDAAEVVSRAVIHGAATAPKQRTANAVRQERYRRNKALQVTESDGSEGLSSPEVFPQTPFPKPLQSNPPSPPKGGSSPAEPEGFAEFWAVYPHKVGKPDARVKFAKAIRKASLETIMAGLMAYVAKTDDRPWCNPATWLHQERWADQPAHQARGSPPFQSKPQTAAEILRNRRIQGSQTDDDRTAGTPRLVAIGHVS